MLQPCLGPDLPQKMPPFFYIFKSSPPSLCSSDLWCVLQMMYSYFILGFSWESKDISSPVLNSVWMFHVPKVKSVSGYKPDCLLFINPVWGNLWDFLNINFVWGEVSFTPNPQPGLPGYPFSPLTSSAWDALLIATLLPA